MTIGHIANSLIPSIKLNTINLHDIERLPLIKIGSAKLLLLVYQLRLNLVKAKLGRHGR